MAWDQIGILATVALIGMYYAWWEWRRHTPLRLSVGETPLASGGRPFGAGLPDHAPLGKVGELITALMHAKIGWRQIPSQAGGVQGIDGIFVRKARGGRHFEIRLVETKCARDGDPRAHYDEERMSNEKVIEHLKKLKDAAFESEPYLDHDIDAIIKAIERSSVHVTKLFYSHMLTSGDTLIYAVRPNGQLVDQPAKRVRRVDGASHRLMLQALAMGLARLDVAGPPAASLATT